MKAGRFWGPLGFGAVAVVVLGACSSNNAGVSDGGTASSSGGTASSSGTGSTSSSGPASSGSGGGSASSGAGPSGSSSGGAGSASSSGSSGGSGSSSAGASGSSSSGGGNSAGDAGSSSVIGSCDPTNLTDKTCLPPEPTIPAGCAKIAAPRTVTPTTEGGTNTLVPESVTETLDNSLITMGFANNTCVELTAGAGGSNAFLVGQLTLSAGETLVIDAGVTVYASRNPKSYGSSCVVIDPTGAVTDTSVAADAQYDCGGVIVATGDHVAIMGEGAIDGQGGEPLVGVSPPTITNLDAKSGDPPCAYTAAEFSWWNVSDCQRHDNRTTENADNPDGGPGSAPNPAMIQVHDASNFVLYEVHLYNSPFFHVQLNSDKFVVWGVDIHTPYGATSSAGQALSNFVARNTDGIDPGAATGITQDGYIVGTTISTGDDMVAIKGSAQGGANNIVIAHNHFGTGHGMSLGSSAIMGITNVHVYDLTIDGDVPVDSNTGASDLNGLRVKSDTGDGGPVQNILFEDVCTLDEVYPIYITASYTANPIASPAGVAPNFQNITVQNFHQQNKNGPQHDDEVTVYVEGDTQHQATVTFDNVWVEMSTGKKGGPVLTVESTATLTGAMNVGAPPAGTYDACTGKTWWPATPTIP
jgi:polygalacturonase